MLYVDKYIMIKKIFFNRGFTYEIERVFNWLIVDKVYV